MIFSLSFCNTIAHRKVAFFETNGSKMSNKIDSTNASISYSSKNYILNQYNLNRSMRHFSTYQITNRIKFCSTWFEEVQYFHRSQPINSIKYHRCQTACIHILCFMKEALTLFVCEDKFRIRHKLMLFQTWFRFDQKTQYISIWYGEQIHIGQSPNIMSQIQKACRVVSKMQ